MKVGWYKTDIEIYQYIYLDENCDIDSTFRLAKHVIDYKGNARQCFSSAESKIIDGVRYNYLCNSGYSIKEYLGNELLPNNIYSVEFPRLLYEIIKMFIINHWFANGDKKISIKDRLDEVMGESICNCMIYKIKEYFDFPVTKETIKLYNDIKNIPTISNICKCICEYLNI